MLFIILLLLFLTSCVSGTFVVNVTQTSYQAEENQNITLEWTFSTRRDTSLRSISTYCYLFTEGRYSVLFNIREGVESPESQDPQFSGRVQWDTDVLTEGRLTLHVSRLRTNDSGFYVCDILVRLDGTNSRRCWLNVTAAAELQTQRPTESPLPERRRDILIYATVTLFYCLSLLLSLSSKFSSLNLLIGKDTSMQIPDDEFLRETNPKSLKPSSNESLEHNVIKQEKSKVLLIF